MIIGSNIQFYESLQSTNSSASLSLKEKELPEGTVIFTDFQTAGKGQQGKRWESEKGKNLLFSVILYPLSVSPDNQFLISMIISLGICDFLRELVPEVKIKWPNDIYVNNDKIAGILIENSIIGDTIESSIAGIGININQEKFSPGIPNPVSLKIITGKDMDTGTALENLLNYLDNRYKQLLYGDRGLIRDEYASMLYQAGEWHTYRSEGIIFKGRIQGITDSGSLKIEKEDSSVSEFAFKEVDYIH
jgi:BirA family biotin operon repressor/biotin-[acetyl-CoA-carboxylase] ligase